MDRIGRSISDMIKVCWFVTKKRIGHRIFISIMVNHGVGKDPRIETCTHGTIVEKKYTQGFSFLLCGEAQTCNMI